MGKKIDWSKIGIGAAFGILLMVGAVFAIPSLREGATGIFEEEPVSCAQDPRNEECFCPANFVKTNTGTAANPLYRCPIDPSLSLAADENLIVSAPQLQHAQSILQQEFAQCNMNLCGNGAHWEGSTGSSNGETVAFVECVEDISPTLTNLYARVVFNAETGEISNPAPECFNKQDVQ